MSNQKHIQFLANQLRITDHDLETVKMLYKMPFATLKIYNGSDVQEELQIDESLKGSLAEFLIYYFNNKKKKILSEFGFTHDVLEKLNKELENE